MSIEFELPEPIPPPIPVQRRWPIAWVGLALLFALFIAGSIGAYFGRETKSVPLEMEDSQFGSSVMLRKGPLAQKSETAILPRNLHRKHPAEAAAIESGYRDLHGLKPEPKLIKTLADSENKRHRALARVFGEEKLSKSQAAAAAGELGDSKVDEYAKLRAKEKSGEPADWSPMKRKAMTAGFLVFFVLGGSALGVLILGYYFSKRSRWPAAGHPSLPLAPAQADVFAARAWIALLGLIIAPILGMGIQKLGAPDAVGSLATSAALIAWGIFAYRFPSPGYPQPMLSSSRRVEAWPLQGIAVYLAGLPAIMACLGLAVFLSRWMPPPKHDVSEAIPGADPLSLFAIYIAAAVAAPIFEEIAIRGLLLPALHAVVGPIKAIIVSSLLFGALHSTGIPAWPALAMIGAINAVATYQTGTLLAAILNHAIHNAALVTFAILMR